MQNFDAEKVDFSTPEHHTFDNFDFVVAALDKSVA
jgi:hypothetical protein